MRKGPAAGRLEMDGTGTSEGWKGNSCIAIGWNEETFRRRSSRLRESRKRLPATRADEAGRLAVNRKSFVGAQANQSSAA